MNNLKFKKTIALILAIILTITLGITVYAHDWPDDIDDWDDDDWKAWAEFCDKHFDWDWDWDDDDWDDYWDDYWDRYWDHYYRDHYDNDKPYNYGYVIDERGNIVYNNGYNGNNNYANNNSYYIDERGNIVYYNNNNYIAPSPNNNGYNSNTKGNGNGYNGAYNYPAYNYYGGVLNVYDAGTEGQAVILAKIIHLYAHGVASQTQQACVGWAVLNSVDASGGGVDIGAIAPNFHYNGAEATTDDFGRDLMPLARDIIFRWKAGRAGISNNGRVLPLSYCYVTSTGTAVTFTDGIGSAWNFSAVSPYGG